MSKMQDFLSLLELPEDVIYEILRFLDATSLYLLSRTCIRLDEIIRTHITLWRRIDARRPPNTNEKLSYCLERSYEEGTHTLLLRSELQSESLIPAFLPKLCKFAKLTILACENQMIDGSKYNVMSFPPQLLELSLKRTTVTKQLEFFKGSGDHFKNLRVLILDECEWMSCAAFMPISKYAKLEIFSVYKCRNVENSIAYLSISAGQGFNALKIFDARLSPLGNTLVRAIHRMQNLVAIYLQNEDVSYKLDYFRRKLDIMKGAPLRDFYKGSDEFDVNEFTKDGNGLLFEDNGMLDDDGLLDYLSIQSAQKEIMLPISVLYLDPYNSCTCGFEETQKLPKKRPRESHNSDSSDSDDDDDDSQMKKLSTKIIKFATLIQNPSTYSRGLFDQNHPRNSGISVQYQFLSGLECDNLNNGTGVVRVPNRYGEFMQENENNNDNSRSIIKLYIFPRGDSSSDEDVREGSGPPSKRRRTDEPGPSGLNAEGEAPSAVRRPPTPHPDVAINNSPNERSASYRIYFRDAPIVQIEDIQETRKDVKVPIKRLSLRGYKRVTNRSLRYINDLDLDLLDLTYTGVTYEGVQKYLKSHPLCRIIHERFCTCLPNLHF